MCMIFCSGHPGVAKISFTGSTATGQRIAEAAAKNGVQTCMELGGKSCLIVFNDANIEDAVEWACFGCFWTNGQASRLNNTDLLFLPSHSYVTYLCFDSGDNRLTRHIFTDLQCYIAPPRA